MPLLAQYLKQATSLTNSRSIVKFFGLPQMRKEESLENKKILLVEDNENDVELTKRALKKSNILNELIVAGICAWNILRNRNKEFFLKAFKVMVIVGIVFTPLQIILGDASGLEVAKNEPTKSAAMEAHWDTNPPGEGAAWVVIAWPDQAAQKNSWEITIPDGLSVLNTRSLKGQVEGLRAFPINDQPPVILPFYAFRVMVLLGIVMVLLILMALWLWIRKKLRLESLTRNRFFWNAWVWAIPIGFIATWCGWVVREVGRQPWIVYGLMRTSDGVSPNITEGTVVSSLVLFILIYAVLFGAFMYFTRRILMQGPDLKSPLPIPKNRRV